MKCAAAARRWRINLIYWCVTTREPLTKAGRAALAASATLLLPHALIIPLLRRCLNAGMLLMLPVLALGAAFLYLAKTLETHGIYWAYRVCGSAWGLCGYSEWLLVAAGFLFLSYFFLSRNVA
jgi:hypothetical protein